MFYDGPNEVEASYKDLCMGRKSRLVKKVNADFSEEDRPFIELSDDLLKDMLTFDDDEISIADASRFNFLDDGNLIRADGADWSIDTHQFNLVIPPVQVRYHHADGRKRFYKISESNDLLDIIDNSDIVHDPELSSDETIVNDLCLILEKDGRMLIRGYNGYDENGQYKTISDRRLLRLAGYDLDGVGGDEINEEETSI